MLFSELYGAYYNAVARIIDAAVKRPVSADDVRRIAQNEAFAESSYNIESALREQRWQLVRRDGTTPIARSPSMPLTTLQRRWIKAISLDPRVRLFGDDLPDVGEVDPLFTSDDVYLFDKYSDGDPYEDPLYVKNFRIALDAVREEYPLQMGIISRAGKTVRAVLKPRYIEYSEKDDKFRLIAVDSRGRTTVNIARIAYCSRYYGTVDLRRRYYKAKERELIFEVVDRRLAMERALLHFAHFKKEAERIDDDHYRITLYYDPDDETELVIRILSFGPFVRVVSPDSFAELIKDRLRRQKSCEI